MRMVQKKFKKRMKFTFGNEGKDDEGRVRDYIYLYSRSLLEVILDIIPFL